MNYKLTIYYSDNFNESTPSGFTIPVIVRVTDVNDNTPNFFDAPYLLNISELTIVGSRIFRNIKAIDADQPGPFSTVEYSIGESPVGNLWLLLNAVYGTLSAYLPNWILLAEISLFTSSPHS